MTQTSEQNIVSFFSRLEALGPLLQAVTGDDLQLVIEIRPQGRRILIDLRAHPLRVIVDAVPPDAAVGMAGAAEDLEAAFLGRLGIMRGVGERRLLLRGGMSGLVRVFPVLDLLPALYGEHVSKGAGAAAGLTGRALDRGLGPVGRLLGRRLATLPRRDLLAALTCLARGVARLSPEAGPVAKAAPTPSTRDDAHPLDRPVPTAVQRRKRLLLQRSLGALGGGLGLARYKLGLPLDLFAILGALSDGVASAGRSRANG